MSADERAQLLELYKDLRVADVRDGMDWNMMHAYGSMSIDIRPLWPNTRGWHCENCSLPSLCWTCSAQNP